MVLFVLPILSGGGAERVTLNFLAELTKRGHAVELLVFSLEGPLVSSIPAGVTVHNLGTGSLRHSISALIKAIRRLQPRIVFSTLGYVNLALLALRGFLPHGTRIWVREANLPSINLPNNAHYRLIRLGYRWLYRTADKVLCTSGRMQQEFVDLFKVSEQRLQLLPNPVNEQVIRDVAKNPIRVEGDGVRYVAAGRLTRQKGFDSLLDWFAEIGNESNRLTILGDGSLRNELTEKSKALSIDQQVRFCGFVERPWPYFAGADAFLLSSRWEGMPNGALEALACGTPVISTPESGGIAEVASAAPKNAVVLAKAGEPFVEAMRNVSPTAQLMLRPSLLPGDYVLSAAVDKLESWINEAG